MAQGLESRTGDKLDQGNVCLHPHGLHWPTTNQVADMAHNYFSLSWRLEVQGHNASRLNVWFFGLYPGTFPLCPRMEEGVRETRGVLL